MSPAMLDQPGKFAVLADIHGNALALEAVLADMAAMGLDEAVNLGDFFSGPLQAQATAKILMQRDFPSIRGNHDRNLIDQDPAEMGLSDRVAYDQLGQINLDWIASLPATAKVFGDVFLCHGTPTTDCGYWLERVDDQGQVRPAHLAEISAEAKGIEASLILCAHTHIPRCLRLPDGRTIVNPGSVGCPAYDDDFPVYHLVQTGTPNASYAIVEKCGSAWSTTFRSVPYESNSASDIALKSGREDWARALRTGWLEQKPL